MDNFIKNEYGKIKFKRRTSLKEAIPEIVGYWDYGKNELSPEDYTFADYRKAWFICDNNHSFERTITGMRGSKNRAGSWCKYCGGTASLTNEDIDSRIQKSPELNLERKTDYIDNDSHMLFLCLDCSSEWSTSWQSIRAGSKCPTCQGRYSYTQDEVDHILKKEDRGIVRVGDYETVKKSIEWRCTRCDHEWVNSWWNVNSNRRGQGCTYCDDPSRMTNKKVDLFLADNNRKIRRLSGYESKSEQLKWKCLQCKNIWSNSWALIQQGSGCPKCRPTSKGEVAISEILDHLEVNYDTEVWFDDLVHIRYLRFDFGIYNKEGKLECLIEYDGRQHFKRWSGMTEEQFRDLKMRDKMKDEYCFEKGIDLIRIPYTEFDYLDSIVYDIVDSLREVGGV